MASTTFVNYQTVIDAGWLNDVNSAVYSGTFQASTITPTNVTSSGAISGATVAGTTSVTTPIVKSGTSLSLQTNGSTAALTLDTSQNATFAGKVASAGSLQLATNGTTTAVTIDTAQNVGIGVTPSAVTNTYQTLQIGNLGNALTGYKASPIVRLDNNCYISGGVSTYAVSGYKASSIQQYNGALTFSVSSDATQTAGSTITFTQAMTLDNSGNLSNTGTLTSGTYTKATSYLWAAGTGAAGGVYLGVGSANGCISQASQGTGTVTTYIGNQTITTISDVRLKENIVDTTRNATEILGQLRVVDHTWNDPSDQCENNRNSRGVWMGLIAQEAQPVIPWLVNKPTEDVDKDGNPQYWHMDYGYSVPLLIKAIQELSAKVTALEAKVGA
jgi:hypothetical protein